MIRLYLKVPWEFMCVIPQNRRWVVHIPFVGMEKFQFLVQFPVDHLAPCLVLYCFCANFMHSLIMWLIVSSLSLHNLHWLFCYVLSIFSLIWLYEPYFIDFFLIKRLISNISYKKTWMWLRKGNLKRETESVQIAEQNNAIRTWRYFVLLFGQILFLS